MKFPVINTRPLNILQKTFGLLDGLLGRDTLNWIYYIPHVWDEEYTTWEDIWLMPEIRLTGSKSFCLTVESLSFYDSITEKKPDLGSHPFLIEETKMIVNNTGFTSDELLTYASIWIENKGFENINLIEGTIEAFKSRLAQSQKI